MKITIDTQTDSHKDLAQVIALLQRIIGESHSQKNDSYTPDADSLVHQQSRSTAQERPNSQPITDFTAIFADTKKPEVKQEEEKKSESSEDMFKILPY